MEVFQPTPILPSNAPPWAGHENEIQASPPHEQYNNRQVGFLPSQPYNVVYQEPAGDGVGMHDWSQDQDGYQDPSKTNPYQAFAGLDRNFCASTIVGLNNQISWSYVPHKNERRKPLSQALIEVQTRRASDARRERQVQKIARQLAALFMRCEGYAKYRARQPKTNSEKGEKQKDQMWPDDMEDAFLRALVRWPPVERKQYRPRPDAKQMGRNECIADYILQATGVQRDRKQVSSHIQVLKPFVQGVPEIMQFLSSKKEDHPQRHAARRASRRASMYRRDSYSWPNETQRPQQQHGHQHQSDLCKVLNLQIRDFEMYMRKTNPTDSRGEETYHTYTTYRPQDHSEEKKSVHIRDRSDLVRWYSELGHLPTHRLHSGRFVGVESSLSVHDQGLTISNPGIELAIAFAFVGAPVTPVPRIKCRTKIFRNGRIEELVDPGTKLIKAAEYDEMDMEQIVDNKTGKLTALQYGVTNFRSSFWARLFWELASDQQSANLLATSPPNANVGETLESRQTKINAIRSSVADTIRGVTAVQEFEASMHADGRDSQIVLTIHWSFHQARDGDAGVTMWRDIDMSLLQTEDWSSAGATGVKRSASQSGMTDMSDNDFDIKAEGSFDASTTDLVGHDPGHHGTNFETFDFGQPLPPYYGFSARAGAGGGALPDLSTLQSPISFGLPDAAAGSQHEMYAGVPSNVWHTHPAILPSSTNAGASPYAHDREQQGNHQHQHQLQQNPYSQNDLEFTGNCHINMSYSADPSQVPTSATDASFSHPAHSHSADDRTVYDSQGLITEIDLGGSLDHHATDPLLLGPYDDHGAENGSTPWDAVRPFSEAFFETGHSLGPADGHSEGETGARGTGYGGQTQDGFAQASSSAVTGPFGVAPTPVVLGLPSSGGEKVYTWLQPGYQSQGEETNAAPVEGIWDTQQSQQQHQRQQSQVDTSFQLRRIHQNYQARSRKMSFQADHPTANAGDDNDIDEFETVDYEGIDRGTAYHGEALEVSQRRDRGSQAYGGAAACLESEEGRIVEVDSQDREDGGVKIDGMGFSAPAEHGIVGKESEEGAGERRRRGSGLDESWA